MPVCWLGAVTFLRQFPGPGGDAIIRLFCVAASECRAACLPPFLQLSLASFPTRSLNRVLRLQETC